MAVINPITVLDAVGATQTRNTLPDSGQQATAGSLPVALSTEQQALLTALPHPTRAGIEKLQTQASGATFKTFTGLACTTLSLSNSSVADLEYQISAAGGVQIIATGASYLITGITNANQVGVRRLDQSNTQVYFSGEMFI